MKNIAKTKEQLLDELTEMRRRIVELEASEARLKQQALRGNEHFLHNVFDSIQYGISVLDCDLNVIRTNAWMEKMYAAEMPLVGKKCHKVYQHLGSPCPWCPSIPAIETGTAHTEIVPYPAPEKPTGWIELSAFPLKDANDHVVGVIEHVKDITERVRAEEELVQRVAELKRFNRLAVGREMRMVELKRQINELSQELEREPPFDLSFLE